MLCSYGSTHVSTLMLACDGSECAIASHADARADTRVCPYEPACLGGHQANVVRPYECINASVTTGQTRLRTTGNREW